MYIIETLFAAMNTVPSGRAAPIGNKLAGTVFAKKLDARGVPPFFLGKNS